MLHVDTHIALMHLLLLNTAFSACTQGDSGMRGQYSVQQWCCQGASFHKMDHTKLLQQQISVSPTNYKIPRLADLSHPFVDFVHASHLSFNDFEVLHFHSRCTEHGNNELHRDWWSRPGLLLSESGDECHICTEFVFNSTREATNLPNDGRLGCIILCFSS